jgi:hypothetical protein
MKSCSVFESIIRANIQASGFIRWPGGFTQSCSEASKLRRTRCGVPEQPQAAVTVALRNIGTAITDKHLNAPEVVAVGVEIAADFNQFCTLDL